MDDIIKKINEHNQKNNLIFDEKCHQYTILDGIVLESVTTKLSKFFPFDAQAISKKVADIRGISQEEVKAEWKKTADDGTEVHLLAEKYCLGHKLSETELNKIKHAILFFNHNSQLEILGCEVKIFSKKHKVAGTVDLIVRNKENNRVYLLDYKTCNKDINKNECFQMAQGHLKEFANNKYYNYSMQLSVYSFIMREEYEITVDNSLLVHLKRDDSYKIVATEDMRGYVKAVLE